MDLNKLKEPMKCKWRVQKAKSGKAVCVPYIDARQAQERLDEVCGPANWQCRHREEKGNLFCEVGIRIEGEWIWKSDVGTESNVEKEKGEASDAFKRAAVMWGVGRFLYDMKPRVIQTKNYKGKEVPFSPESNRMLFGDDVSTYINSLENKNAA